MFAFVSDLMNASPVTAAPDTTLADAARIMLARHVTSLPVLENGRLAGVISEGDLLRRLEIGTAGGQPGWLKAFFMPSTLANEFVREHGLHVRDVMTSPAITAAPDDSLAAAADLMTARHIKRLPVVADGILVGVISRTDLLRALARRLIDIHDPFTETEIRDHIISTLAQERWAPRTGIHVKVAGDTVELEGIIFSAEEQRAVMVIAETTPGIRQVVDHLTFVDPGSGMAIPAS